MKYFAILLAALFVAAPAFADSDVQTICTSFVALAATDDNQPLLAAGPVSPTVVRVGCAGIADVATPAAISFENAAGTALTHATLTCAEAGAAMAWQPITAGGIGPNGILAFDVDNSSTTGDVVVCAQIR